MHNVSPAVRQRDPFLSSDEDPEPVFRISTAFSGRGEWLKMRL